MTVKGIGLLFRGVSVRNAVAGPLRITYYVGAVASSGFALGFSQGLVSYFRFLCLLSIVLFLMNLLPIPALDGGQVLVSVLEILRRRPVSPRLVARIQAISFSVLLVVAVAVDRQRHPVLHGEVGLKRKLVCFCEHEFESEVPESVDLAAEPGARRAILEGDFQTIRCPSCGKALKPEFPVLVRDAGLIPVSSSPSWTACPTTAARCPTRWAQVDRVAIGYDELVEKLRIRDAGLDDRVVEVLKYYLLQKVLEHYEGEGEVRLLFSGLEPAGLVFHALGLRDEEVGVLRVSRQMAEKSGRQLEEQAARGALRPVPRRPLRLGQQAGHGNPGE